jgi:hypothetical protein
MPFCGLHAVEAEIIVVGKAVGAVSPDLIQGQDLVALGAMQQICPVITFPCRHFSP